ncbi:MAG: hypothetical protein ACXABY_27640 [Candidatus Thorarchaeota archaeon]|jgi:hypothetical protein
MIKFARFLFGAAVGLVATQLLTDAALNLWSAVRYVSAGYPNAGLPMAYTVLAVILMSILGLYWASE